MQNIKVPKTPQYGIVDDDGVLWKATNPGKFVTKPRDDVETIWDALTTSVKAHGALKAAGWREVISREMEPQGDKTFEKLVLGPYNWLTYDEYFSRVESLGAAFVKRAGLKAGDHVVIFAETQKEWLMSAYACWRQNLVVATAYATLGEDGAKFAIRQTGAKMVITDAKLLPIVEAVSSSCPDLKHVVTIGKDAAQSSGSRLVVTSWDDMVKEDASSVPPTPPAATDTALIMYTSGTTGLPKGVLISHGNFMAGVAGTHQALGSFMEQAVDDVYLAYLPLAHIMEMMVEVTNMSWGVAIGYGSPHTLTNTGVKLAAGQTGDAPLLQPTVMVFAPAVLDKVYSAIQTKVSKASPLVQKLFHMGLATGVRNFNAGGVGAGPIFNTLVFKKIQALLGGRVRAMITGSAPLSADVQKFVQTVFNCPVRQGYGLTETCAGSVMAFLGDNSTSCVGAPTAAACIRLRDWPEGNYLSSDKDKPDIGMPRGEVLIGGPMVTQGYLIDPDNIDEDVAKKNETEYVTIEGVRYFCSGDIGQINKDGNLQIIDRKKDLVKLQQGEYVALSKVENALKISEYVEIPMCYAHSSKSFCIALICPSVPHLQTLAQSKGIDASDIEGLCKNKDIIAEVSKSCLAACKQSKLVGFEIPKKIALISDPWTPENDMLTAAMKLKRQPIVARHKDEIDAIYQ
mmetsp:Transcript_1296/g.3111  ORF Transcript_1296/g.3111 Transcript_1296/m.3111 type:complete len:683 (-) Transcript_1296:243-2291(-)